MSLNEPPALLNANGERRKVGVELEFAAVSARRAAELVKEEFGGEIVEDNAHRFNVRETQFGEFVAELDTQYAHPEWFDRQQGDGDRTQDDSPHQEMLADFRASLASLIGTVGSVIVPCEIVCPPVELRFLPRLEELVERLRESGAEGTEGSIFYAFGLHLNVEMENDTSAYLTSMLKAYALLSAWLRREVQMDVTRSMLSYTDPFSESYASQIIDPDYRPNLDQLIDDYLAFNPTRNRELDMLPIFALLDEAKVREAVGDARVGKRPAFHYRLPNFELTGKGQPLIEEWNRWCEVERLAHDPEKLSAMAEEYLSTNQTSPDLWAQRADEWIK